EGRRDGRRLGHPHEGAADRRGELEGHPRALAVVWPPPERQPLAGRDLLDHAAALLAFGQRERRLTARPQVELDALREPRLERALLGDRRPCVIALDGED